MIEFPNISWDKPWFALVFLLVGVIAYLLIDLQSWRKKIRKEFADSGLDSAIFGQEQSSWLNLKFIFLIISLFFLTLALMGPLWGEEEQTMKREGIDMVFALDLSNSMNAEDIAPSRLLKAKQFIKRYIETLGGDRVGLVVFAGEAYTVAPLTSDYAALDGYIDTFDTNLLWNQGTNMSSSIIESVNLLGNSPNVSKAIILISDGEDHEKRIGDAIDYAKDNQVDIFTIGVGKTQPSPIPMTDTDGWDLGYKEDDDGKTVMTSFHGEELRNIAEQTNGSYTLMTSIDKTLETVRSQVNMLEKNAESEISTFNKKQQYQWFLVVSILFFFIYTLTPDKKYFKRL
ncbi:VWA domain-containing protein [Flavobacteriaceae bacterium Ap0902]|nr:VWA domain-containing protein [Flavobacteriaceae bacterium Ap0902]